MFGEGIVRVGYCLNAKKMRRSDSEASNSSQSHASASGNGHATSEGEESFGRVGVSRWRGGGLADLLTAEEDESNNSTNTGSSTCRVRFEPFEAVTNRCLKPFDVIIHKLTEDLINEERERESGKGKLSERLEAIRTYLARNPRTVILDPLHAVNRVVSRLRTMQSLLSAHTAHHTTTATTAPPPFQRPNFLFAVNVDSLLSQLPLSTLQFPLICKPVAACGAASSHKMAVIVAAADLSLAPFPCVVTEYLDHDELLFKVYVIDREVMVFRRRSLPNVEQMMMKVTNGATREGSKVSSVVFDSREDYPTARSFLPAAASEKEEDLLVDVKEIVAPPTKPDEVPFEAFKNAAQAIRKEFELSLFGFDVVRPSRESRARRNNGECGGDEEMGSELVIIDVNYFPSYKEVADFPQKFRAFLAAKAAEAATSRDDEG